ncbi:hypothetical protein CLAIMM_09243 [Cladophialophora immunda]|nr:hypothetical protein CLAIMM_09243 [Cladophialophora immunda]
MLCMSRILPTTKLAGRENEPEHSGAEPHLHCHAVIMDSIKCYQEEVSDSFASHHSTDPNKQAEIYQSPQSGQPKINPHTFVLQLPEMVQYDQFNGMFPLASLPSRGRTGGSDSPQSPSQPMHPILRRLSSASSAGPHYCARCHLRRTSQERRFSLDHECSSSEEEWDGFCPDIAMPKDLTPPPSPHHKRRHSCLCPVGVVAQEHHKSGTVTPVQMIVKEGARCPHYGHHNKCNCQSVLPEENLEERYGLVEEPAQTRRKLSLEKGAANQLADIMHAELISDMAARNSHL